MEYLQEVVELLWIIFEKQFLQSYNTFCASKSETS